MIELKGRYNEAKIFTDVVDATSVDQVMLLLDQEFAAGSRIRLMPDIHAGAGCTIGTTMTIKDKAVPNLVGVDIGCGMETVELAEREIDYAKLDALIRECAGGDAYLLQPEKLVQLERYKEDASVLNRLAEIKAENKRSFAGYVARESGVLLNTDAIFDVQVKRLHEYKRQLLNVMHITYLYQRLKADPHFEFTPRVYLFGAKAAPGYSVAKEIIHLINSLAATVNADPACKDRLQVVFLENYRVSLAEKLMPASELSEQISTAGKEASGTGNMKFMMNGALTIGTLDGANVEMHQQVGDENIFLFGLKANEVAEKKAKGYRSYEYYMHDEFLKAVIDQITRGFDDGVGYADITNRLLFGKGGPADEYMLLADFAAYCDAEQRMVAAYQDAEHWNRMSLHNIARSGIFAADRSVAEYADTIWNVHHK